MSEQQSRNERMRSLVERITGKPLFSADEPAWGQKVARLRIIGEVTNRLRTIRLMEAEEYDSLTDAATEAALLVLAGEPDPRDATIDELRKVVSESGAERERLADELARSKEALERVKAWTIAKQDYYDVHDLKSMLVGIGGGT